ncbi:MAG: exo-alpha-sialidase [Clostridia bacterium]|nr:exo-alpha-sialidase [Clostridia bacterium]
MKGTTTWSYTPYRPFFFDSGDIYVCRLAPDETAFHCEWLSAPGPEYQLMLRPEGEGEFTCAARVNVPEATACGLRPETDYEFYVQCGEKKSRVRLFRTGKPVGTVVNYLHPRDGAYAFSGQYLCSPSMLRHPDGYLLSSMDLFAGGTPQNLSLVFRSDDDGKTWHYLCDLFPCFWGKLFLHGGKVYMLACSTEYGDLLIGRSDDGGFTFGAPTVLLRGSCKCGVAGVHKHPQPVVAYRGRLYETLEWGSWGEDYHAAMVMSADADADLLDPASWHFTPPVKYDPAWPGVAKGPSSGNIEGSLVVAPDGKLYNVMRYDMSRCEPNHGLVLAYRVDTDDPDAPLQYDHAIRLPGNPSKFMIKRDEKTGLYFTIISRILDSANAHSRNLLSLMVSPDMERWDLAADLIDRRDEDPKTTGFQYVDWMIEGDDLLYLVRTAINQPHNFHDANYQTFHRLRDFRKLVR